MGCEWERGVSEVGSDKMKHTCPDFIGTHPSACPLRLGAQTGDISGDGMFNQRAIFR